MYSVDLYRRVCLACRMDGLSQRQAALRVGVSRDRVKKMLAHSVPPGYRRSRPPKRLSLNPFTAITDRILEEDRSVPLKQRHTAKRIFERLRDEQGFDQMSGGTLMRCSFPSPASGCIYGALSIVKAKCWISWFSHAETRRQRSR